ncbi:MAG: hypothetical protein NVSMB62_27390 [Acidobacteriaceae bacterium]
MEHEGDQIHVSEREASGGEKGHLVRWVLGVSLALVVGLLSLVWIVGAIS